MPSEVYILKKQYLDFFGDDPQHWITVGFTYDISVANQWFRSGHRDEEHEYEKVKEV